MNNNEQENEKKAQEDFTKNINEAFKNFLGENTFTPGILLDFLKNVLYIDKEQTIEGQKNIKIALESFKTQIEEYYNMDDEKTKSFFKNIYSMFPNSHVKNWGNFTNSVISFDDSKDFKNNFFGRRFPIGTISYIGARPGRGKTTALINLALEALSQGKKVVYATAEETTKQLITRLILAETYLLHEKDGRTIYNNFKPRTSLFNFIKSTVTNIPGINIENGDFFGDSMEHIKKYIDSRQLTIFEAYGGTWDELTDYLANQETGTIVLIDYIQHLRTPAHLANQTRQIQVQETSHQLADLAGVHNLILICGAQFNRPDNKGKHDLLKTDTFDETSFREAGDIEQDGHILIGIGKNPKTEELFYSCMKDRENNPDNGKCWKLKKNMAFSFLRGDIDTNGNKIEYIRPGKEERQEQKKAIEKEDKLEAMKNFKYGGK